MNYVCNPINIEYKYQFVEFGKMMLYREAADPSLIRFKGKYYLFPSMTAGFLTSSNLADWEYHALTGVPLYDYAPDVRVIGEWLYFSASSKSKNCSFFRTKDPIEGKFEEIPAGFPFWDPNLFLDDDGRIYFYWGCSNLTPIYGVELHPEDMTPLGEAVALIFGRPEMHGFERNGEDHVFGRTPEQIEELVQAYANSGNVTKENLRRFRVAVGSDPYIEGAWMDKYDGRYYLQYASPATEVNVYSDGVYVSAHPLGPFTPARNNPYSYKPGGFIPGAGHGSTLEDEFGNRWHAASMRISVNHPFERRMGLWPAGFDPDGELFCNQRYGDWPMKIEQAAMDPWSQPEWMLLSYGKPARASSCAEGKEASLAVDENIQTWWKAASPQPGEWLELDLEQVCNVHAIQLNFADDGLSLPFPEGITPAVNGELQKTRRHIEERKHVTRWLLEGSVDGTGYFVIEDKSEADSDLPHDLIVKEAGVKARFIRCTVKEFPYGQTACISGLRVFGLGEGEQPDKVTGVQTRLISGLDLTVSWDQGKAAGYNVLWGFAPEKLYHSYMVYGKNEVNIGALVKGQSLYVRVDAFNEAGITEGDVYKVID